MRLELLRSGRRRRDMVERGVAVSERERFQQIFHAANTRLASFELSWCREIETRAVRALRFAGPRPPMVRQLLRSLADVPEDEALRDRVHWTLRRLHRAQQERRASPDGYQVAANAYLDGQADTAVRWLDMDTLIRPWGAR